MKFRRAEPEHGRVEKIKHDLRCRVSEAGHRIQAGVKDGAPRFEAMKTTASHVSANMAGTAQDVAHNAADAAQSAAGAASSAVISAGHTVADRARPVRDEAVNRGTAAWAILRSGVPPRHPLMASLATMPVAAAGKAGSAVKSKGNSALVLVAAGGLATMGVLWWRRSRTNAEGAWITDPIDADEEPRAGWHESSATGAMAGDGKGMSASEKPIDCVDPEACRDPAHTWP